MDEKFSSLSKDVEQIKNNTNAFGSKIKLPGNDDKNAEEVSILELIIKGIAASLFGTKLTSDNEGTIKSLFDPKKSTLQSIAENFKNIDINDKINSINNTLKSVKTVLSDINVSIGGNNLEEKLDGIKEILKDDSNVSINNNLGEKLNAIGEILKGGINVSISNNLEGKLDVIEKILRETGIKVSMIDTKEAITLDLNLNSAELLLQDKFDQIFENENLYKAFQKNIQTSAEHALLNTPLTISDESYDEIKKKFNNIININQIQETLKNTQLDPLNLDIQINLDEDSYNETQKKISKIVGNPDDIKDNVNQIANILNGDVKENINKIFNSLNNIKINIGDEKLKQLSYLSTFLSSLISILESSKINDDAEENFNIINNLLKDNGPLAAIFENLNKEPFTKAIDGNVKKNLDIARVLFESLSKLIDIKFGDVKKSEKTLRYINGDFFKHIEKVISNINKLDKYANDINIYDHLQALTEIIDAVPAIASVSIFSMLKSRISIKFLNHFIKNDLPKIFDSLEALVKDKKESFDNVKQLSVCIDSILKLFELDGEKIENSEENLEMLNDLISNNVQNVINAITRLIGVKESAKYIKDLSENVIDPLNELLKSLPSISTLLKADIKLSLMSGEMSLLYDLLTTNKEFRLIKRKIEPDKILGTIKDSIKVVKQIKTLNSNILSIEIKGVLETLYVLDKEIVFIESSFNQLGSLLEKFSEPMDFDNLNKTIENFNNTLNLLKASYNKEIQKIAGVNSILETFLELLYEYELNDFSEKSEELSNFISNNMLTILEHFKKGSNLDNSLKNLMFIDPKTIKTLESVDTIIKKIALISNMKLLAKISEKGLEALEKSADKIIDIVNKFKDIDDKGIDAANKSLKMLMKVVIGSAAILIFGTIMMKFINIGSLLLFTAALGGFVYSILTVYSKLSKDTLESGFDAAFDFGLLIAISGATLIFGSLLFHFIDAKDLLGYTLMLGGFIIAMLGTYALFSGKIGNTFDAAFDFGMLIAISGATLIFGSLLFHFIDFKDLFGFATILGTFIATMMLIYWGASVFIKKTLYIGKEFSYLLVVSAALLIFGALTGKYIYDHWKEISIFTVALAAFIFAIVGTYAFATRWAKGAIKDAKSLALLITISSLVMILGVALINNSKELPGDGFWTKLLAIAAWGAVLGGFIFLITFSLKFLGKNKTNLLISAAALALITIVCAGALILGPYIIHHELNDNWGLILGFGVGVLAYVTLMGLILKHVFKKIGIGTLLKGIFAIAMIGLLTLGAAYVVKESYNYFKDVDFDALIDDLENTALIFAGVGVVATAIGALLSGPQAWLFAGGLAAIAGIEAVIWGAAKVINAIAVGFINLKKATDILGSGDGAEKNTEKIMNLVNGFGNILALLCDKISLKMMAKLPGIIGVVITGAMALNMIANVVKNWANLWVPDLDKKTGKIIGYRKLSDEEIGSAAENIRKVLEAIGTAIMTVIQDPKNKDIFGEGFFGGKSPFEVAMKSFKYSGDVLSGIAQGIKDWSSMAIPKEFDENGKPKGYISLNDATLTHTQENIEKVLKGLGSAIVNTVKNYPSYFATGNNSPVMTASRAINLTAKALTDITNVIKTFSNKDFKDVIENLNGKTGVLNSIETVIGSIINILNLFLKPVKGSRGAALAFFMGEKSFAEYLNDNSDELSKAKDTIAEFGNSLISIFNTIGSISESFQKNLPYILLLGMGYDKDGNHAKYSTINILHEALGSILFIYDELININKKIYSRKYAINDLLGSFELLTTIIGMFVFTVRKYDNTASSNLALLTQGLVGLYKETTKFEYNNGFNQYVEDIEKFVQSINGIDFSKFNAMTSLVNALNELSEKFGNLDQLTENISEKLTAVLLELVNQLRHADRSIQNAHELQEKRKILIENSVKKVKELMSQHMVVEVKKEGDTTTTPSIGGGYQGPAYDSTQTVTPTDNESVPEMLSPEVKTEAKDAETVKESKFNNIDALTLETFQNLMSKNFDGWKRV